MRMRMTVGRRACLRYNCLLTGEKINAEIQGYLNVTKGLEGVKLLFSGCCCLVHNKTCCYRFSLFRHDLCKYYEKLFTLDNFVMFFWKWIGRRWKRDDLIHQLLGITYLLPGSNLILIIQKNTLLAIFFLIKKDFGGVVQQFVLIS